MTLLATTGGACCRSPEEMSVLKHVVRRTATVVGVALLLSTIAAAPAHADTVPDGCAGSLLYACTGEATVTHPSEVYQLPVTYTAPSIPVFPGTTVGGQQIGGVAIPVGGQTIPGMAVTVGPTDPVPTGIVLPVGVCAFVTCIAAGSPVVVPGLPLPVVPVVVPSTTVPGETIDVPVIGSVPVETIPAVVIPSAGTYSVTLTIYKNRDDFYYAARQICTLGGGGYDAWYAEPAGWRFECDGGLLAGVANAVFEARW